jgi:hypothetical protein
MTPTAPELLRGSFLALVGPAASEADLAFSGASVRVIALLCFLLAQETETAAKRLVAENRGLRALFRDAADGAWAPDLTARLAELGRGEDQDLALEALEASNAVLRRGVIALGAAVEATRSLAGHAREARILRLLKEGAEARLLSLPSEPAR